MQDTVIIARRRRGKDYWEGYSMVDTATALEWQKEARASGVIAKIFADMTAYRADCKRMLDMIEAKCAARKTA